MRGPPPQSSTLFHRLQLRPTAVQTLTFLSAINLLGMKARCSLCPRHAKNPRETRSSLWSGRLRTSLRKEVRKEEGDETICISKQLRRAFLPAGPSMLCTHLGSNLLQRHRVGTFELRENLCHWSYLNPLSMLQCYKGIWQT